MTTVTDYREQDTIWFVQCHDCSTNIELTLPFNTPKQDAWKVFAEKKGVTFRPTRCEACSKKRGLDELQVSPNGDN